MLKLHWLPIFLFCVPLMADPTTPTPSHLMVGPGIFNVDRQSNKSVFAQVEYRWEVHCHHLRPLVSACVTTDAAFFICGGIAYDIFLSKRLVFTPSFAPGVYYKGHGKNLGFPINFRSALELSLDFKEKGRFGAQFNHISNAHMFYRNPGANSLFIFYAIPFPSTNRKASGK